MKRKPKKWSKKDLKLYILMLCAKADNVEDIAEIDLIKSKTSTKKFHKLHNEFWQDDENESLEKIQEALEYHEYSELEICQLKREIHEVFAADRKIPISESNLGRILENIIY